jgi:hypothetical protein
MFLVKESMIWTVRGRLFQYAVQQQDQPGIKRIGGQADEFQ